MVEHISSKHMALNSNFNTAKKKKEFYTEVYKTLMKQVGNTNKLNNI
jgi:hypothetical protein